jgi:hypothetical protein
MTALMQEVFERVHALPEYRRDDVVLRLLDVISEEEKVPEERIVYVEIADDLTDEERAGIEEARRQRREHPEESISLRGLMSENGITEEDLARLPPTRLVYNM